jgi:bisphosphoglycerate-dependent phosphoglycerate mutase
MLHLLRHAKSSWKEDVEDHERALSRRGREAARRIGKHLPARLGSLDLVLCSSARRTRETLDLVLAEYSPQPRSLIEDELYFATRERLMHRLRRLDETDVNVLLRATIPGSTTWRSCSLKRARQTSARLLSGNSQPPPMRALKFRRAGRHSASSGTRCSATSPRRRGPMRRLDSRLLRQDVAHQ